MNNATPKVVVGEDTGDSIERLQKAIANSHVSVVSVLHQAMPLAKKLGDEEFLKWATGELNGHAKDDAAPGYRHLKGEYVVLEPSGRSVPIHWGESGTEMSSRFITLSLAETESIVSSNSDTFAIKVRADPEMLSSMEIEPGSTIGFSVTKSTVSAFLSAVRQRVLEWTMTKLETVSPPVTSPLASEVTPAIATVFYSWQSDLPNRTNRGFIEDCLKRAIKELNADGELQVQPCLDRDTMNVPGSPDIAATIFDKIDSAALFVCDVSIINKDTRDRPTPNPNVLVELGYAVKTLGWNRVLCVFNGATGTIEQLPFDLRHRRVRNYQLEEDQEKGDSRKLLTRLLKSDIQSVFSFVVTSDASLGGTGNDQAEHQPHVEILRATIECQPPIDEPKQPHIRNVRPQYIEGSHVWSFNSSVFVESRPGDVLSVPLHKCKGWMSRKSDERIPIPNLTFHSESQSQVTVDDAIVLVRGPGKLAIQGSCETPFSQGGFPDVVGIEIELPVVETGQPIPLRIELEAAHENQGWPLRWKNVSNARE